MGWDAVENGASEPWDRHGAGEALEVLGGRFLKAKPLETPHLGSRGPCGQNLAQDTSVVETLGQ